MSFDNTEKSGDLGTPFELYEFVYGDTADGVYRYTNYDRDIDLLGFIWKSVPISRETYRASGKTEKVNLSIKVPIKTDLAALFTDFPPTQVVRITIRAAHASDLAMESVVIWTGRVLSVSKETNEAALTCDSTLVSMKRPGLRRNWQYGCPYVLYGKGCNADQAAATRTAKVVAITETGLTLEGGWAAGTDMSKFAGGMLRWRGATGWEYRTIRHVTEEGGIQWLGPLRDVTVGMDMQIILGCDHTVDDCEGVHNNIVNYGGQPWIPTKNPVRYHPWW